MQQKFADKLDVRSFAQRIRETASANNRGSGM